MAKRLPSRDAPPDLFSHAAARDEGALPVANDHVASQPPHLLPQDIPGAVRQLPDHELEKLFNTVNSEMRRRQLISDPAPVSPGNSSNRGTPKKNPAKAMAKPGPPPVTQAKMNAIRAALKAGVKPNTIARQFGTSLSAIMKALESAKS